MAVAEWKGGKSRSVDSIDAGSLDDRCPLARYLAQREGTSQMLQLRLLGNIVLVTGKDDIISDGRSTVIVSNGNALLGKITGVYS